MGNIKVKKVVTLQIVMHDGIFTVRLLINTGFNKRLKLKEEKALSPMQIDATLLDDTYFVHLHTLLLVVACCWELLHKVFNRSNF